MIDASLIQKCADPSLKPAIVKEFVKRAGSDDPLKVTVRAGSKTFVIPKPKSAEEAQKLVEDYIEKAVVRVGITQYPAGLGIKQKSDLSSDLFDACKNIGMGTALFAKVYRITTKWYGAPAQEAFDDAIYAYGTGYFDGKYVFAEPDPGEETKLATPEDENAIPEDEAQPAANDNPMTIMRERMDAEDPNKAGIAIDLSGIKDHNSE
jgi:hypothetical protein